jgi:hypothetical protein
MNNTDGKKLEVLMKRCLFIIFPRTLEGTLNVTSAWLCSWEWVLPLFCSFPLVLHIWSWLDRFFPSYLFSTTCKCWLNHFSLEMFFGSVAYSVILQFISCAFSFCVVTSVSTYSVQGKKCLHLKIMYIVSSFCAFTELLQYTAFSCSGIFFSI